MNIFQNNLLRRTNIILIMSLVTTIVGNVFASGSAPPPPPSGSPLNGETWSDSVWCANGKVYTGDFNGDGYTDVICHSSDTGEKWIRLSDLNGHLGNIIQGGDQFCRSTDTARAQLNIGDLNYDGRDDLVCVGWLNRWTIDFASITGRFSRADWYGPVGIFPCFGTALVGDFDGDDKDDLFCSDRMGIDYAYNGYRGIDYEPGKDGALFCEPIWSGRGAYHFPVYFHVGDFNNDGRSDLLCTRARNDDGGIEDYQVLYADSDGSLLFNNIVKKSTNRRYKVGDFNGDGYDDLIYFTHGYAQIDFADINGHFEAIEFLSEYSNWCALWSMQIGDFNGDGRDDLVCAGNGYDNDLAIAYSNLSTPTPQCMPNCDGRQCGTDGCGGSCGNCGGGFTCSSTGGQCIPFTGCVGSNCP